MFTLASVMKANQMHRTIWESHLLIKMVVNPKLTVWTQPNTFIPSQVRTCISLSFHLFVTQSDLQAKRYAESWIQRLQCVICLEKSTKALFLIQSLGRYCSTFLLRPAKKQEVKLHTTPIWDNRHYLPCYHVKSACHFNVLILILIHSSQ